MCNKPIFKSLIILVCLFNWAFPLFSQQENNQNIKNEIEEVLVKNILHVWYPRTIDTITGGDFTNYNTNWEKMPRQEKMIVTQTRGVWTACKAAEHFPNEPIYRKAADHGFLFLKNNMWDPKYGGFFTIFPNNDPKLESINKMAYGNSFAIYALAAYAKLTHNKEALELAQKTFWWLEKHCRDSIFGGYFDVVTREGISATSPNFTIDKTDYRNNVARYKDFNSTIHLLEAFAELYQVWPDPLVRKRLEEMLVLVRDTFTTKHGYLRLYFKNNWQHVSYRDSSDASRKTHLETDHVTFGHDIETAYLLLEAAARLGLKNDPKTLEVAKKLNDHTLKFGIDPQNGGVFDGGIDTTGNDDIRIVMPTKSWWGQAEALNAMLLFSKLYPNETHYRKAFEQQWRYMQKYVIDYTHGDWYINGTDTDPRALKSVKASAWECNYHTSRALLNCLEMLEGKEIF